jgi:hypothetical protein
MLQVLPFKFPASETIADDRTLIIINPLPEQVDHDKCAWETVGSMI